MTGLGPEFAPSAQLSLGRDSNPRVAFRGRGRLLSESVADGFRTYEKHPWDAPPHRGEQVAGLQGGLVSLPTGQTPHSKHCVIRSLFSFQKEPSIPFHSIPYFMSV